MKKRVLSAALAAMLLGISAIGCGGGGDPKETLTVFNYGEYMDPIVLDMFEDETGIEVKYEEAPDAGGDVYQVCVRRGGL